MANVHPTAIVAPGADLDEGVTIGPYTVIGPHVRIGAGTTVGPHAVIDGDTTLGKNNRIFQFAAVGGPPQDLKYRGERTRLTIGDGCTIREFATVHLGTEDGGGITRVGNGCLLMAYTHVAHDVQIGNHVIMSNSAQCAGHVIVEDYAILAGASGVHQFVRIGKHAFIGGMTGVGMDVPPFCIAAGARAELSGLNSVGLQRHGFTEEQLGHLKDAYKLLFRSKLTLKEAMERVRAEVPADPNVDHLLRFIEGSQRGLTR
jgi:UDP-N-acetylglucosamine acyltransferase